MESKVKTKSATWVSTTPTKRPLAAEPTANCPDVETAFWTLENNATLATFPPPSPTHADQTALCPFAVTVLLMLVNNVTTEF